jgi:Holliday junction resolvase RusA-like endonuclease
MSAMKGRPPILGAVSVEVTAVFPVPKRWPKDQRAMALSGLLRPTVRPDADNIAKLIDGLMPTVFMDDSQVVNLLVKKVYGTEPHILIEVTDLNKGLPFDTVSDNFSETE